MQRLNRDGFNIWLLLIVLQCLSFQFEVVQSTNGGLANGCFWTGCQDDDDWDSTDCTDYDDMMQVGIRDCGDDGTDYQCCPITPWFSPKPSPKPTIRPSTTSRATTISKRPTAPTKIPAGTTQSTTRPMSTPKATSVNPSDAGLDQMISTSSVDNGMGCWWTGCQKNDWAVVGCSQYNMTDKETRDCQDGKEYYCCPKSSNSNPSSPPTTTTTPAPVPTTTPTVDCWWTGCQKNEWAVVGCSQYNRTEKNKRNCDGGYEYFCCVGSPNIPGEGGREPRECLWSSCQLKNESMRGCPSGFDFKSSEPCEDGDLFQCCEQPDRKLPEEIEPLSGGSYESFVQYLLLKARNFTLEPNNLRCDQLDPGKEVIITVGENDGIRMCDLCPSFPLVYLSDIFLDRIPSNTTSNVDFQDCFAACEASPKCLALSYDKESVTCYLFNATVGIFTDDPGWKTVLMTQPSGVIENWYYSRHTSISGTFYKIIEETRGFRECLKLCSAESLCNHVSFNLDTNACKMYSNISSIDYIDMNYGWLTAFNLSDISANNPDVTWRFTRDENNLDLLANSKTSSTNDCTKMKNSTHSAYFSKECYTSGALGCDSATGCRTCYYPENSEQLFDNNLPACPDSIMTKSFELANEVSNIRMVSCLSNPKCFGVGVNGDAGYSEEITAETFYKEYQTRYMLKYPKTWTGLHEFLMKNDFLGDYDFVSSGSVTEIYNEMTKDTIEECFAEIKTNDKVTKVSYSLATKKCKVGSNQVKMMNLSGQGLITMIKHPEITSSMAYYTAIYGISLDTSRSRFNMRNCRNCEETCADYCKNEAKSWCGYYSIIYDSDNGQCWFYEDDDSLSISASNQTITYKRTTTLEFNLESLNKLDLFQPGDVYGCFLGTGDPATGSSSPSTSTTGIALRSRRGIFDKIGNFFKKVGKAVVDTVKKTVDTVVDTAKGAVQSVGKLVKGDLKGAKDAFMKIPVVKDVKNAVELGGAVIKGDWKKAKEKGADLLQSSTLDLVTSVIPGGKIIGKGLSAAGKALGNTGKVAKNDVKKNVGKTDSKDKKLKDKDNQTNNNNNNNNNNDKNRDQEQRGSQCQNRNPNRRKKRAAGRKRPGNDCDDEDDGKREGCPRPNSNNIIDTTTTECNNRKAKAKCNFECEPGYAESDPSVTCTASGKNQLMWNPPPRCVLKTCSRSKETLIVLETPKSRLSIGGTSKDVVAYVVNFNSDRKLPIWSIAFEQSQALGQFQKRASSWKKYPCTALTGDQADDKDYAKPWHKGHLTPANVALWSPKAARSTNMYINCAPQDGVTNEGSWRSLESHVKCFGGRKKILVTTGICDGSIGKSGSIDIPSCYWKMLCYEDEQGETVVVGFKSDNTVIKSGKDGDADKAKRKAQIYTPLSQDEISKLYSGKNPWTSAAKDIYKGREASAGAGATNWTPVNPLRCAAARKLLDSEKEAWEAAFARIESEIERGKGNPKPKTRRRRQADRGLGRGCIDINEYNEALALAGLAAGLATLGETGGGNGENIGGVVDNGDGSVQVNVQSCGKRIIGYYTSWGKKPITGRMMQKLTHVIYAFLEISSDGSVNIGSPDRKNSANIAEETEKSRKRLEHLMGLRNMYPHVKILFAVGGWENSQYFSAIAASPAMRHTFMTSIIKMIQSWDFDGVDIDWEYPVTGGANEGVPADKDNYVNLMKEMRGLLDSLQSEEGRKDKYLLSFAGAAGQWTLDPGFDLPGLLKYADFANIMTYDYFGAWASKWGAYTGPPSPLFFGMPPRFSGKTNAAWTVKYYTCKSKLPHQLNMGVPFYGRYWKNVGDPVDGKDGMWRTATAVNGKFEGDFVAWDKIGSEYLSNPSFTVTFHEKSKTPYAWSPSTKTFLGFENEQSLGEKVKYATDKNVGGLMVWAIDLDDDQLTLLDIVSKAPLCSNTDPNNVNHVCSPIDEKRWWTPEDGGDKEGLCGKSAPLYKGYYPVCDPDDPGYSCCGKFGYCGTGPDFCDCPSCKDYGKDPRIILEGAIKPSVPVTWYLLNDPDGKRGRCGRKIEKINGQYPTCNPDDDNNHCCSNGGYCGATSEHCECSGCVDFRKNPNYKWGPKKWWTLEDGENLGGSCGPKAPKVDGIYEAECDPDSATHYCCSPEGWCGSGKDYCDCNGCKNFKNKN